MELQYLENHFVLSLSLCTLLPSKIALTGRGWGMDQVSKENISIAILSSPALTDAKFFLTLKLSLSFYYAYFLLFCLKIFSIPVEIWHNI
jgi:hypothetical protein